MKKFVLFFFICLFSQKMFAGTVYWYVDEDGVTHFTTNETATSEQKGEFDYKDIEDQPIKPSPQTNTNTVNNTNDNVIQLYDANGNPYIVVNGVASPVSSNQNNISNMKESKITDQNKNNQQNTKREDKYKNLINLTDRPFHEDDFEN